MSQVMYTQQQHGFERSRRPMAAVRMQQIFVTQQFTLLAAFVAI